MARAATTLDAFNAIAEKRRRDVLEALGGRRMAVNDLTQRLGWPQPMVSKHLRVLRRVGLVRVQRQSRRKFYEMNAEPLRAVHEWTRQFERFWTEHLQQIKQRAEASARAKELKESNKPKENRS